MTLGLPAAGYGQATPQQQEILDKAPKSAVPLQTGVLIGPQNSRISFVGIHVGDDPKPRLGGFSKFTGFVGVDPASKTVTQISIDIDIKSVWTEFSKLTAHLMNADFFEVDKFDDAKFVSTKISAGSSPGKIMVTGDLTLHGQTQEISFPAEVGFENGGVMLKAQFQIDRSQFGMDQMLGGVDKMVAIDIFVGQSTEIPAADGGHGGGKKKQSSNSQQPKTRTVSLKVPNMT
ncbi:MAG: YceI family protein [Planctomycetota bacterium]